MNSIIQEDTTKCFLCGRNGSSDKLEKHHVFGASNRNFSEKDGLFVYICGDRCHRNGKESAHRSKETSDKLKMIAQEKWLAYHGSSDDFIKKYGRNYL